MIYWVRAGDVGPVKVGYAARDVAARLKLLQTGCPYPLALLRTEPGGRDLEAALHRHYRAKHLRAEWFVLDKADVSIGLRQISISSEDRALRPKRERSVPAQVLHALGGYREVASELKLTSTRVHNWTRRGIAREFWPNIVDLAKRKGKSEITFDVLRHARPQHEASSEVAA